MSDLSDLIAKLEAATEGSRFLDVDIAEIDMPWTKDRPPSDRLRLAPAYTTSIDAALTLVPEGFYWSASHGKVRPDEPLGAAQLRYQDTLSVRAEAEAATAPLAICLVALMARQGGPVASAVSTNAEGK